MEKTKHKTLQQQRLDYLANPNDYKIANYFLESLTHCIEIKLKMKLSRKGVEPFQLHQHAQSAALRLMERIGRLGFDYEIYSFDKKFNDEISQELHRHSDMEYLTHTTELTDDMTLPDDDDQWTHETFDGLIATLAYEVENSVEVITVLHDSNSFPEAIRKIVKLNLMTEEKLYIYIQLLKKIYEALHD